MVVAWDAITTLGASFSTRAAVHSWALHLVVCMGIVVGVPGASFRIRSSHADSILISWSSSRAWWIDGLQLVFGCTSFCGPSCRSLLAGPSSIDVRGRPCGCVGFSAFWTAAGRSSGTCCGPSSAVICSSVRPSCTQIVLLSTPNLIPQLSELLTLRFDSRDEALRLLLI